MLRRPSEGRRWACLGSAGLALGGCAPLVSLDDTDVGLVCDAAWPSDEAATARRVGCTDEVPAGGEARKGDWLLVSSRLRAGVRDGYGSLTRIGAAGGTLVDLAGTDGQDRLVEVLPLVDGLPLVQAEAEAEEGADGARVRVRGVDAEGRDFEGAWVLAPGRDEVGVEGMAAVGVVLPAGSTRVGQVVWTPNGPIGFAGAVVDHGGWLTVEEPGRIAVGEIDAVHLALWPDGQDVGGAAEGTAVEALDGEGPGARVLARLDVVDGAFEGRVPAEALALRATAAGHRPGPSRAIDASGALALGQAGSLRIRVRDREGGDIPATLWWRPSRLDHGEAPWTAHPMPPGGGTVPLDGRAGEGIVTAGPLYEVQRFAADPAESPALELDLERCCTPALLAELALPGWPDRAERGAAANQGAAALARGVGFAVLVATDEIAPVDVAPHDTAWFAARPGSTSTSELGWVWSWPWSANDRRSGHGAIDGAGLSAADLLAAADGAGSRWTVVDAAWLASAPSPALWSPRPAGLRVEELADLDAVVAAADQWASPTLVGPLTWIEGQAGAGSWRDPERTVAEIEAALLAGRTVATNGPRIALQVDGAGPGMVVESPRRPVAHLRVEAPRWMELDGAALITGGGRVVAQWALEGLEAVRLEERVLLDEEPWVLAVCWGPAGDAPLGADPWWAMTTPIWLSAP